MLVFPVLWYFLKLIPDPLALYLPLWKNIIVGNPRSVAHLLPPVVYNTGHLLKYMILITWLIVDQKESPLMFAELEVLEVKMASMKVFMFCCGGVKRSGILFFTIFFAFCAQKKPNRVCKLKESMGVLVSKFRATIRFVFNT